MRLMHKRFGLGALLCAGIFLVASVALAAATTAPSELDADDPVTPATGPTPPPATAPSTQQANAASKFPSPGELVKRLKDAAKEEDAKTKVAFFDLSDKISERPEGVFFLATTVDA